MRSATPKVLHRGRWPADCQPCCPRRCRRRRDRGRGCYRPRPRRRPRRGRQDGAGGQILRAGRPQGNRPRRIDGASGCGRQRHGYVVVVFGDHPLLRSENFAGVIGRLDAGMDAASSASSPRIRPATAGFITEGDRLLAIREHKDATDAERTIGLCNACILAFRAEVFRELIDKLGTPTTRRASTTSPTSSSSPTPPATRSGMRSRPSATCMGVNDRAQLAQAEATFQEFRRDEFMKAGVTLRDPATVYFSWDTEIARDVVIEPNVVVRARREDRRGREDLRLLAHRGRDARRRRHRRPVRAHARRRGARGRRPHRQFRRAQEGPPRQGREGRPPELSRRRRDRRGHQHRRRHHHLATTTA